MSRLTRWIRSDPVRLELSEADSDRLREILEHARPPEPERKNKRRALIAGVVLFIVGLAAAALYIAFFR